MSLLKGVIDIDSASSEAINGVFGESIAEERVSDILVQFQYNYFDEQFDVAAEVATGDGTSVCTNNLATVSSATTGTVYRSSRDSIRYRPAHTGYAYLTASFVGTGIGKAGCSNATTGFALKVSNGNASFGYIKNGVETGSNGAAGFDDQAVWDNASVVSGIDFTKLNIFLITFGYLGVANPTLWIKKNKWIPLHSVKTEGRLTTTHVDTPVFPIGIYAENGMTVSSGSWGGGTIGNLTSVGSRGFAYPNVQAVSGTGADAGQMTLAGTTVGTVAIFRSKATFQSQVNNVKSKLVGFSFSVDSVSGVAVGNVIFQLVGGPTLSGTATYADINTNSSVMEIDHTPGTGASVTATLGIPLVTRNVAYAGANKGGTTGQVTVDADSLGAFAYAGDVFAIIAKDTGGNNITVRVTLNWEELF